MPRPLMLLLPATGCVLPVDVDGCSALQVVEVMTAGEFLDDPLVWSGQKMDFIELQNVAEEEAVNVEGCVVRLLGSNVVSRLPPLELDAGDRALLVASTYELVNDIGGVIDRFERHPDDELGVPYTGVLLDMNNDASEIELRSPEDATCQLLGLPDQHAGWSWSAQLEAGKEPIWCRASPTPGEENAPCTDR